MKTRHTIVSILSVLAAIGSPSGALAHGAAGGDDLLPGEFRIRPVVTLEGHAGLENNLNLRRRFANSGLRRRSGKLVAAKSREIFARVSQKVWESEVVARQIRRWLIG